MHHNAVNCAQNFSKKYAKDNTTDLTTWAGRRIDFGALDEIPDMPFMLPHLSEYHD